MAIRRGLAGLENFESEREIETNDEINEYPHTRPLWWIDGVCARAYAKGRLDEKSENILLIDFSFMWWY